MDQIFTSQFWHDQWAVVTGAPWVVIPLLLIAGFVGWIWKGANNKDEISALKAHIELTKERLKYLGEAKAELEQEYKELKAELASDAPNKEELLAVVAKIDTALTKLSKANTVFEGPSSEDLELLISKISPFSGTEFDVGGSNVEYPFLWSLEVVPLPETAR
jgi:hypothetical protein